MHEAWQKTPQRNSGNLFSVRDTPCDAGGGRGEGQVRALG